MPVPAAVLNVLHPVISMDLHQPWIPPAPPSPAPVPHFWFQILGGLQFPTVKSTKKTYANFTSTPIIQQGSDIGPLIVHIPSVPHILLPLIILGSGSVSEFGAFSVQIENRPVGTAIVGFAGINLNCAYPFAMPTGIVVAISTVCAGMTLADYLASVASMVLDIALSAIMTLVGLGGNKLGGAILGQFARGATLLASTSTAVQYIPAVIWQVLGAVGLGSPVGYSSEDYSVIGHYWGNFRDNRARDVIEIVHYFDPPPGGHL